jgi:hypothetical protein
LVWDGGVGLRGWLKRLEREAWGEMVEIPQRGGTVARFPQSALREAYANHMARLGAGEGAPPEHPLLVAARNSSDASWLESVYVANPDEWVQPVEDLSEP